MSTYIPPSNIKNLKNVKLGVSIEYPGATSAVKFQGVTRMSFETSQPIDKIHGLEANNQAVNPKPADYTWTLNLPVHSNQMRIMDMLMDTITPSVIKVIDLSDVLRPDTKENALLHNNQLLEGEIYYDCYITKGGKEVKIGEVTYVTYSGFAMRKDRYMFYDGDISTVEAAVKLLYTNTTYTGAGTGIIDELDDLYNTLLTEWPAVVVPEATT